MIQLVAGHQGVLTSSCPLRKLRVSTQKVAGLPVTSQPRVTVLEVADLEVADPQLDCEQLCSRARAVGPCPIPYRSDRPRGS